MGKQNPGLTYRRLIPDVHRAVPCTGCPGPLDPWKTQGLMLCKPCYSRHIIQHNMLYIRRGSKVKAAYLILLNLLY